MKKKSAYPVMKKVIASVIIPNWNGKHLLDDCLQSLKKQTFKEIEVIVVDNGSTDGSVSFLENKYPWVKIVAFDKNYGFAKAINKGVLESSGEYVIFLNNDTAVDKKWVQELVKCISKHKDMFSINPKILNFFDHQKIDGVGIEINEVGQARSIGWEQQDTGQFNKEMEIFGATGGAALFRKDIFLKAGMFDENYFMYSEEVDLAFRAQFLGYKSFYCPKAVVYHKHKASSKKRPQHLEYWQFKNMTQTIIKDFPNSILVKNWRWLKIVLIHFNTILYQLKNGFFWPPLMTEVWLISHLPILLYKRYKIQKAVKVSDEYIEKFLTPKKVTFWGLRR